jgi:BMFP domain-containing protein YqiC
MIALPFNTPPKLSVWLQVIAHTEEGRAFIRNLVADVELGAIDLSEVEQALTRHDKQFPATVNPLHARAGAESKTSQIANSQPNSTDLIKAENERSKKQVAAYTTSTLAPLHARIISIRIARENKLKLTTYIMEIMDALSKICEDLLFSPRTTITVGENIALVRVMDVVDLRFMMDESRLLIAINHDRPWDKQININENNREFRAAMVELVKRGDWVDLLDKEKKVKGAKAYSWVTLRDLLDKQLNDNSNEKPADLAARLLGLRHLYEPDRPVDEKRWLVLLEYPIQPYELAVPTAFAGYDNPLYRSRRDDSDMQTQGWGQTLQYLRGDSAQQELPGLPELICKEFWCGGGFKIRVLGAITT